MTKYFEHTNPFTPGTTIRAEEMNAKLDLIADGFGEAKAATDYLRIENDGTKVLAENIVKRLEGDGKTTSYEAVVTRLSTAETEIGKRAQASDLVTVEAKIKQGDDAIDARITTEMNALATREAAQATLNTSINAKLNSNESKINTEITARTTADSALSQRIDNIVASAGGSTAAIDTETKARISADDALASQMTTLSARMNTGGDIKTAIDAAAQKATAAQTSADGKATASDLTALRARIDGNGTSTKYESMITRMATAETELGKRAMATDVASMTTKINDPTTGLDSKAAASTVTTLSNTVAGKADASRVSTLETAINHATTGLASKAAASDLTTLSNTVTGKADASRVSTLETAVNHPSTGLATKASASSVTTLSNDVATKAAATRVDALESTVNNATTGLASKAKASDLTALTSTVAGKADASRVTTLETAVNHPSTGLASKAAASDLTALTSTVDGKADASRVTALETTVNNPTTGLASKAKASDLTTLSTTVAGKADASRVTTLETAVNHPSTGLSTRASQTQLNTVITDVAGKASSSSVNTVSANLAQTETKASDALANAAAAQNAANAAQTSANSAISSANTANATLADIAADNKLTAIDKQAARKEWEILISEKAGINTHAVTYPAVASKNTAYNTAMQALGTYLNNNAAYTLSTTVPPSWINDANLASVTTIVGQTFRDQFEAVYVCRQDLLNAVAIEAGKFATWSGINGAGKPADNATVGAPSGTLVGSTLAQNVEANASTALTATSNISGKLLASWSLTLDANKRVSGVKAYNDGSTSGFDILADAFRVSKPNDTAAGQLMFEVGMVNGVSTVGIRGNALIDGSVTAKSLSVTNLQAVTANTGTLYVTGDLHMTAGAILGGARAGWVWPVNGAQNMYVGPNGLLLGNYYAGASLEYNVSNGMLYMKGGTFTASDITAGRIKGGAYTGYAWAAGGYYLGPEGLLMGNINTGQWLQWDQASGTLAIRGNVHATSVTAGIITADHIVARGITNAYSSSNGQLWIEVPAGALVVVFVSGSTTISGGSGGSTVIATSCTVYGAGPTRTGINFVAGVDFPVGTYPISCYAGGTKTEAIAMVFRR